MTPAGAVFSRCRRWRYLLWRCWDESKPVANFLMLNPSTADERKLDPSCTRARNYAERWGFGAVVITNIFGWRATDPEEMKSVKDPVGRSNDAAIVEAAREANLLVCAWGNHGAHLNRSEAVLELLRTARIRMHVLRVNGAGYPAHPLYLPATLKPTAWKNHSSGMPASLTSRRQSSRSARLISSRRSGVEPSAA
ncbi:MAG TPA: DUF1643 domain-containing protein [Burkholderiales bacterium]|nr:DUF1643 domain-containing protein [Burkholderiales bacterium]